jgi:hypothetical protein
LAGGPPPPPTTHTHEHTHEHTQIQEKTIAHSFTHLLEQPPATTFSFAGKRNERDAVKHDEDGV